MKKNFNNWFNNNLVVGSFPFEVNELFNPSDFDFIINVSDEFYLDNYLKLINNGLKSFWFPMNEAKKDIGINSIYGAMVILYNAEVTDARVYLHCHAGVNRSQLVKACYYYMRTGEQYKPENVRNGFINKLYTNCHRGYLPSITEMELLLKELNDKIENLSDKNIMGGLLDTIKLNNLK